MEIQQMPMIDEPEESHARESQKCIPDFIPEPLLAIAPGFQTVVDGNQRAQTG